MDNARDIFWQGVTVGTMFMASLMIVLAFVDFGVFGDKERIPEFKVQVYEDGSGAIHRLQSGRWVEYQIIEEGVLIWDCATMGNETCGPDSEG